MTKTNAKAGSSGKAPKVSVRPQTPARRRRRSKRPESTSAIMDRLLASPVSITMNGETTRVSADEAIFLQLLQKAMSGSVRASRALLKYEQFAHRRSEKALEVTFVDSDYTAAFASFLGREGNG